MQVSDVAVGTELFVFCKGRGGHGAWMRVTKLNRKSFDAVETDQSYRPGQEWRVSHNAKFAVVERNAQVGWHRHWVNE